MKIDRGTLERFSKNKLNYDFNNYDLLTLSLSHKSVGANNNERLEFLGDSILNYIIAEVLYEDYPKISEGKLTRMRAYLVCKDTLYEIAKDLDIDKNIILSGSENRTGGHQRVSILADAVEALIAAIRLDSDVETTRVVVRGWYEKYLRNLNDDSKYKDPKTNLQEYLQSFSMSLPAYEVTKTTGPAHDQIFHVSCKLEGYEFEFNGNGESRRKAEQVAAGLALDYLNSRI